MDGHPGPQGLDRIPPTGRLTVNTPLTWGGGFRSSEQSPKSLQPLRNFETERHIDGLTFVDPIRVHGPTGANGWRGSL